MAEMLYDLYLEAKYIELEINFDTIQYVTNQKDNKNYVFLDNNGKTQSRIGDRRIRLGQLWKVEKHSYTYKSQGT